MPSSVAVWDVLTSLVCKKSLKSMQDDWNAPDYMNWEHEKPRNGPFVGLAKVSIDFMNLETCRRSWKYIDFGLILIVNKNEIY